VTRSGINVQTDKTDVIVFHLLLPFLLFLLLSLSFNPKILGEYYEKLEGCASVQGEKFYEGKRNIIFLKGFLARQKMRRNLPGEQRL